MVCMLALGETLPKASSHRGVERKSGFQVLVVLLGLRRERVEVFFVPLFLTTMYWYQASLYERMSLLQCCKSRCT
jgi:hypothetical protein